MAGADGTNTAGVVPAPPAEPPLVGLIAALGPPGGRYLDPPDAFPAFDTPGQAQGDGREPYSNTDAAQRWEEGFEYLPEVKAAAGSAVDPCSPNMGTVPAKSAVVAAMPFYVWDGFSCSAFGVQPLDAAGRALRALLASESKQIAAELWLGTRAQAAGWPNHYLAHNAWADVLSSLPVSVTTALDCLEGALGSCGNGQPGAIHCTRQLASAWSTLGNVYRSANGVLTTYLGTVIIPDAGYDGSGPDGQPAVDGNQWAYATMIPQVRRGEIEVFPDTFAEATLRTVDDVAFRARRLVAVSFPDVCHLAISVNLPLCLSGGVS